jgi:hypothetical protein
LDKVRNEKLKIAIFY